MTTTYKIGPYNIVVGAVLTPGERTLDEIIGDINERSPTHTAEANHDGSLIWLHHRKTHGGMQWLFPSLIDWQRFAFPPKP